MKTIPVAKVKELIKQLKMLEEMAKIDLRISSRKDYHEGESHAYFRSRKHAERLLQDNTTKRTTDKT